MLEILRKTMLYKTGVEYGDYTINHVLGCSHGCKYPCYAFLMAKRFGKVSSYEEWINPKLAVNALDILDKEIPRLKSKIQSVQLSFTTDPFMYGYQEIIQMSMKIIEKLNASGIKCSVLTKGILPLDLTSYSKENEYGITLISLNEDYRRRVEPGASPYNDRLVALRELHDRGFQTWVSIEPYPTPNIIQQDLTDILEAVNFADKIIFGRTNYSKEITSYTNHKTYYNEQAKLVANYCNKHNIQYHIKSGTETNDAD